MMVSVMVRERMRVRPMVLVVLNWVVCARLMGGMAVVLVGDQWASMMVPVKVVALMIV